MDGQINFNDYFEKQKLDIKPMLLVDFINGMGTAQYTQIGNVISQSVSRYGTEIDEELIGRITNNVSVWLLKIGSAYANYLSELIGEEN